MKFNKKKLSTKNNLFLLIFLFTFFFVLNFSRLLFDTYNLEWYFIELSKYFTDQNYYFDINLFKQNQANTTFYSLFFNVINNFLFSYKEKLFFVRIFQFFFFLVVFYYFYKIIRIDLEKKIQLLFLLLFCPIITVYLFRVYPDLLSVLLAWLSLIFFFNKNLKISIVLYCISFLLKPVSIIILPFFFLIAFYKFQNKILKIIFCYLFFIITTYCLYFFFYEKIIFGDYYKSTYYSFNFLNTFANFLYYYNYIVLLISPLVSFLIIDSSYNKNINVKKIFYFIIISIPITIFLNINAFQHGELNYSYINKLINNNYLLFFIIFFNTLLGLILFNIFILNKQLKNIFIFFLVCIFFLSVLVARPSQRYLIYLLPFIFFLIIEIYKNKKKYLRISFFFYILVFSLITYGQKKIQQATLDSTNIILSYIENYNLFELTHPGEIYHSHGYLFKKFLITEIKLKKQISYIYQIDDCLSRHDIILKEKINLMNINIKKLCLKKLNKI
jgi:hypothetical protein